MTKVKIEVTEEQARIISQCLEFAGRFSIGQLDSTYMPHQISELLFDDPKKATGNWCERRDIWDSMADGLKRLFHPGLSRNASKTYSFNDFTRNCFSMQKMINVKLKEWRDQFEDEPHRNVDSSFIDIYEVPVAYVEVIEEK